MTYIGNCYSCIEIDTKNLIAEVTAQCYCMRDHCDTFTCGMN